MIYILAALLAALLAVALYYKDKAEEFESLFELSKEYRTLANDAVGALELGCAEPVKYNKDGSIAKKRGRPVGSKRK